MFALKLKTEVEWLFDNFAKDKETENGIDNLHFGNVNDALQFNSKEEAENWAGDKIKLFDIVPVEDCKNKEQEKKEQLIDNLIKINFYSSERGEELKKNCSSISVNQLQELLEKQTEKKRITRKLVEIGFYSESEIFDILTEDLFSFDQWKNILKGAEEKMKTDVEKYQISYKYNNQEETVMNFLPGEKEIALNVLKAFKEYGNPFGSFKLNTIKK